MKKQTFMGMAKEWLKAGAMSAVLALGACDLFPERETEPDIHGAWETDSKAEHPLTFLSCDELTVGKNLSREELENMHCDAVIMADEKLGVEKYRTYQDKKYCMEHMEMNRNNLSEDFLKWTVQAATAKINCAKRLSAGEKIKRPDGGPVSTFEGCYGYYSFGNVLELLSDQEKTCEDNFGL